jgi:hypothetical protein
MTSMTATDLDELFSGGRDEISSPPPPPPPPNESSHPPVYDHAGRLIHDQVGALQAVLGMESAEDVKMILREDPLNANANAKRKKPEQSRKRAEIQRIRQQRERKFAKMKNDYLGIKTSFEESQKAKLQLEKMLWAITRKCKGKVPPDVIGALESATKELGSYIRRDVACMNKIEKIERRLRSFMDEQLRRENEVLEHARSFKFHQDGVLKSSLYQLNDIDVTVPKSQTSSRQRKTKAKE